MKVGWRRSLGGVAVAAAALLAPGAAASQPRLGLFFDDQARVCTSTLERFGPSVRVYIFAMPDGIDMVGVLFTLRLPLDLQADHLVFAKDLVSSYSGSFDNGLDLQFNQPCPLGDKILILEFDLQDVSFSGPLQRPDLKLHLEGAAGPDSIAALTPRLKICDPGNPEGNLGMVYATSLDAFLNCTQVCGCEAALVPRAWAGIKTLYRER